MLVQRFLLLLLTMLFVSGWSLTGAALAHERDVSDIGVFYDALAPYGEWMTVEDYGDVWIPYDVDADWRPYTHGQWVYTEAGWTWVSDYEWGWAPFHYGRWARHPRRGWLWVPGTVWGPAWVSWRHTPGWVGWAPLPPQVGFQAGIGLGAADMHVDIAPEWFSFVDERHLLAPRVRRYMAPPARNVRLIRQTRNVTNITVIDNRVIDRSIDVKHVERVVERPVPVHRIVEVDSPRKIRGSRLRDREREVVLVRPEAARALRDDDRWRRERQPGRQFRDDDEGRRRERDAARQFRDDDEGRRRDRGEFRQAEEPPVQERQSRPDGRAAEERPGRQERESARQERQPRSDSRAAEDRPRRQETDSEPAPARQQQASPAARGQERQQQERSDAARGQDRRDEQDLRQAAPAEKPEAPESRRQRRQQSRQEQEAEERQRRQQSRREQDVERRQQTPASQSGVTESQ